MPPPCINCNPYENSNNNNNNNNKTRRLSLQMSDNVSELGECDFSDGSFSDDDDDSDDDAPEYNGFHPYAGEEPTPTF